MARKSKSNFVNYLLLFLLISITTCLVLAYQTWFSPALQLNSKENYLYINKADNYYQVELQLTQNFGLRKPVVFRLLAKYIGYTENIKPGKYKLDSAMSTTDLIKILRSGKQEPVKLTFVKFRQLNELAKAISLKIEADSGSIHRLLTDKETLNQFGLSKDAGLALFIPNTYEIYWNTSATALLNRMFEEYKKFWNTERTLNAQNLGLSPQQVIVLASIVQEETNKLSEMPTIAGVYWNRLNKNMQLQADPTVKFALADFQIKRVNTNHTKVQSPYNTYFAFGLPPGPICTPSPLTIDAVLQLEKHNYLYFCAKEDFSGFHNFALTFDEHLKNAARFHMALNKRKIFK